MAFGAACLRPGAHDDALPMTDLIAAYGRWREGRYPKLPAQTMAEQLAGLIDDCDLAVADRGGTIVALGVRLVDQSGGGMPHLHKSQEQVPQSGG